MPTPNEIGTLRAGPNGESLFVGSSSGVFFINTVRRAFSQAASTRRLQAVSQNRPSATFTNLPSPEDCIIGPESHEERAAERTPSQHKHGWFQSNLETFGTLPDHDIAKELLITYFRTWHAFLPFLHGPTCLSDLEDAYASGQPKRPKSLSTAIIFQCLFSIARLDRPDLRLPGASQIQSEEQLMLALSVVSLHCDMSSIQALLAAELYFVAIMDVRAASTVDGMVLRTAFKLGLHRCPVRYTNLTTNDHDMRKRVFWSAYCLDRYVSQVLGHPLGIQDSDFDVCVPGEMDLHQPVQTVNAIEEGTSPEETVLHLPVNHPLRQHVSALQASATPRGDSDEATSHSHDHEQPNDPPTNNAAETDHVSRQRLENQSVQAHFVRCSKLIGRMMETFHKSIHVRAASRQNILFLKADIDGWGNDLPQPYLAPITEGQSQPASLIRDVFFWVARQHLLLLVNRPSLSLEPVSAEFQYAAQICIGAAKSIIRTLDSHANSGGALFWPGWIHSVWMSGLVMAFTCQLKQHSGMHAINDINASLKILKIMAQRWRMAQNCHDVLLMLLENIKSPDSQGGNPVPTQASNTRQSSSMDTGLRPGEKRPRESRTQNFIDSGFNSTGRSRKLPRCAPRPFPVPTNTTFRENTPVAVPSVNGFGVVVQDSQDMSSLDQNNHQFPSARPGFPSQTRRNSYGALMYPDQIMHQYDASNSALQFTSLGIDEPYLASTNQWPAAFYDVFDGAGWGTLLDLVEDNR